MDETDAAKRERRPKIDVSSALGEAGHEVEELGFEGIPDVGPALRPDDADRTADTTDALDIAATEFPTD